MNPITQVTTLMAEIQARLNSLIVDFETMHESMTAAMLSLAMYDWMLKSMVLWNLILTIGLIWLAYRVRKLRGSVPMPRLKAKILADIQAEPVKPGQGVYAAFNLHDDSVDRLIEWNEDSGLGDKLISPDDYHVTSVYSRQPFDLQPVGPCLLRASFAGFELFGPDKNTLVALLDCPILVKLFNARLRQGMETDFPEHKPHVTLAKDVSQSDLDGLLPLDFPIYLKEEVSKPLDEDFSYDDKSKTEAMLFDYLQRARPNAG